MWVSPYFRLQRPICPTLAETNVHFWFSEAPVNQFLIVINTIFRENISVFGFILYVFTTNVHKLCDEGPCAAGGSRRKTPHSLIHAYVYASGRFSWLLSLCSRFLTKKTSPLTLLFNLSRLLWVPSLPIHRIMRKRQFILHCPDPQTTGALL